MEKVRITIFIMTALCLLFSCATTPPDNQQETAVAHIEEDRGDQIDLSIYVENKNSRAYEVAEHYMEAHPDVYIEILPVKNTSDVYIGEPNGLYINTLRRELADGDAPDLIWAPSLPYQEFIDNGWILDLAPYIGQAENLKDENYYTNFFEAYRYGDGIYSFPISIMLFVTMVGSRQEVLTALEAPVEKRSWDFEDFAAIAEKSFDNEDIVSLFDLNRARFIDLFLVRQLMNRIDRRTKTVDLADPSFTALLEGGKKVINMGDTIVLADDFDINTLPQFIESRKIIFKTIFSLMAAWDIDYLDSKFFENKGIIFPFMEDLNTGLYPIEGYAVNAGSDRIDLAWDFLLFWAEHDSKITFPRGFSIKRSVTGEAIGETKSDVSGILENVNRQAYDYELKDLFKVLKPIIEDYLSNNLSTEDTAEKLEEAVTGHMNW